MEFKKGDTIRMKETCSFVKAGSVHTLTEDGGGTLWAGKEGHVGGCWCERKWVKLEDSARLKVGDKVKIIRRGTKGVSCNSFCGGCYIGKTGLVKAVDYEGVTGKVYVWPIFNENGSKAPGGCSGFGENDLRKLEVSLYEDLEQRIEELDDGWNKDADDILAEMGLEDVYINIGARKDGRFSYITALDGGNNRIDRISCFNYNTQEEKLACFKKLLLQLLDYSDIKKDNNEELKAQVREMEKRHQQEIDSLKDQLK